MTGTSRPSARLVDDQTSATIKNEFTHPDAGPLTIERSSRPGVKVLVASGVALAAAAAAITASHVLARSVDQAAAAAPPSVGVSVPLQREVDGRLEFLGQFSAVQQVDLRAQVGGNLTQIGFKDGDIVHQGDLLVEAKYNGEPDYGQASAALCGALFQMAIENAGSLDRDKVRDELAKLDVVTFFGPVRFGPNGQINSLAPPVFQIQGAKPVVLFPLAIKQGDLKVGVDQSASRMSSLRANGSRECAPDDKLRRSNPCLSVRSPRVDCFVAGAPRNDGECVVHLDRIRIGR